MEAALATFYRAHSLSQLSIFPFESTLILQGLELGELQLSHLICPYGLQFSASYLLVASKTWAPREVSGRQGLKCQQRGLCCQTVGFKSRLAVGTATHGVSVCSSVNGADGIK